MIKLTEFINKLSDKTINKNELKLTMVVDNLKKNTLIIMI